MVDPEQPPFKGLKRNKVKITTSLGSFTVQLYDNVPYHKANFIHLKRKGYFDSTQFHRVGKGDWPFQNIYILKAEVIE